MHVQCIVSTLLLFGCNGATFKGNKFVANHTDEFLNHIIDCNDNQDCTISCEDHQNSCSNAIIQCPSNGNCNINCHSGPSDSVCKNITITCPSNGNCNISCTSNSACKNATIYGNTSNSLNITCKGNNTCQNTHIDGRSTHNFLLECGTGSLNTCASLTLFFPPNINGNPISTIIAGDECSAGTNNIPMLFYAYNGWNDINITNYMGTYSHQIGTMHCGLQYEHSCAFKSNAWECAHINDICNNPLNVIKQTETTTLSPNQEDNNGLLYGIVVILIICVLCLGGLCIYFIIKYTKSVGMDELAVKDSQSELERDKVPQNPTHLIGVASLSKSSINQISSGNTPVTTGTSSSNRGPITMRAYRSYSNRSQDQSHIDSELNMQVIDEEKNSTITPLHKPAFEAAESATPQPSSPRTSTTTEQNTPIPMSPLQSNEIEIINISQPQIIQMQVHPSLKQNNKQQFVYNIPPIQHQQQQQQQQNHISIPSTTTSFQPSLSSIDNTSKNSTHIVYQQPGDQHQLTQMVSIMNQSAPPSLSEFIKNTNYQINQNPIPPSNEQSFVDNTPRYSGTISNTNNKMHKLEHTNTQSFTMSNILIDRINIDRSLDDENENENENENESDGNDGNILNVNTNNNIHNENVNNKSNIINELQTAMENLVNNPNQNDINKESKQ